MDAIQNLSLGFWQKTNFFEGFSNETISKLVTGMEICTYSPKQIVFQEEDPADFFCLISDGFFKIYKTLSQHNKIAMLDFVGAGDVVAGLLMCEVNSRFPATLQAIEHGSLVKIPRSTYDMYWTATPEAIKRLQMANLERMRSIHDLHEANRFEIEKRVAWTLLKYFKKLHLEDGQLRLAFTRTELSELINTTPESVMRVISLWKREGLIEERPEGEFVDTLKLKNKYFITNNL